MEEKSARVRRSGSANKKKSARQIKSTKSVNNVNSPEAKQSVKSGSRGQFKRILLKFGEKTGNVEKTEYPPEYLAAVNELEQYKIVLDDLLKNLCSIIQQDSKKLGTELDKLAVEYTEGCNPFERLEVVLRAGTFVYEEKQMIVWADRIKLIGQLHREYQRRARKALKPIRTFIFTDYEDSIKQQKELKKARQEMNFARYELSNANQEELEMRTATAEEATKTYNEQLTNINVQFEKLSCRRVEHSTAVSDFQKVYRAFHDKCRLALKLTGFAESSSSNVKSATSAPSAPSNPLNN